MKSIYRIIYYTTFGSDIKQHYTDDIFLTRKEAKEKVKEYEKYNEDMLFEVERINLENLD